MRAPCIACKQQPWFGERVRLSCKNGDDIDDDKWRDRSFEIACGTVLLHDIPFTVIYLWFAWWQCGTSKWAKKPEKI